MALRGCVRPLERWVAAENWDSRIVVFESNADLRDSMK